MGELSTVIYLSSANNTGNDLFVSGSDQCTTITKNTIKAVNKKKFPHLR